MSDLTSGSSPTRYNHLRGIVVTLGCDEGNVTVTTDVVTTGSGSEESTTYTWATQLKVGDVVKMSGDLEVIEASAGDEDVVGFVQQKPSWFGTGKLPWTSSGSTTDLRHAPIELLGTFIREVEMGTTTPTNALAVGDSVTADPSTQHEWTQHETGGTNKRNHTMVMKVGAVDTGKSVVLFGYTGALGVEL